MSTQPMHLTVEAAQKILREFNCIENKSVSNSEKDLIRQALLLVSKVSDYQILGICAETATAGLSALASYTKALNYQPNLDLPPVAGAVYIKFNPKTGLCYLDAYSGQYRGVLVSCQSAYGSTVLRRVLPEPARTSSINEMYGHLPLDLFE